jgi:hypothetical protein
MLHPVRLLSVTDSTKIWRKFRGSGQLVLELAGTDAPAEDFQEKIARLKAQFDPA